ncbi:glycosyltransferase [Paraclostridium ghonii]|uniref:glycosyltransferase family 2 protein n=1 Tax=Paraclostridium ghonii TaxID=29358 RepID=UPI0035232917
MLISIIVPVYNAEIFLTRCLESIKNQTYLNLEVILVNDGSTDSSGLICDKYSKIDSRFICIHKENEGVSSARNIGLSLAKGKYIGFVDSDDWIEPNMFENLYKLILDKNADIAMCGYVKQDLDGNILNKENKSQINLYNTWEALNNILDESKFRGFLCNKLFSKEIINQACDGKFKNDIHFCEDLLFCCQCILKSKVLVYDSTPYYHYIIHNNNTCKLNYSIKKLTSLTAVEEIIKLIDGKNGININDYKTMYIHMNISLIMYGIYEKSINKSIYRDLKNNLHKYKIRDINKTKVKISCIVCRINTKAFYLLWNKVLRR